jgi:hypothetical protein
VYRSNLVEERIQELTRGTLMVDDGKAVGQVNAVGAG